MIGEWVSSLKSVNVMWCSRPRHTTRECSIRSYAVQNATFRVKRRYIKLHSTSMSKWLLVILTVPLQSTSSANLMETKVLETQMSEQHKGTDAV